MNFLAPSAISSMKNKFSAVVLFCICGLSFTGSHKTTVKESEGNVLGTWDFIITTSSGNGNNQIVFSGDETAGIFTDSHGHGGPWHINKTTDSIFWEYKTGKTLPAGLVNKIAGKLNTDYTIITAKSAGIYNGENFTGEWKGIKQN